MFFFFRYNVPTWKVLNMQFSKAKCNNSIEIHFHFYLFLCSTSKFTCLFNDILSGLFKTKQVLILSMFRYKKFQEIGLKAWNFGTFHFCPLEGSIDSTVSCWILKGWYFTKSYIYIKRSFLFCNHFPRMLCDTISVFINALWGWTEEKGQFGQ